MAHQVKNRLIYEIHDRELRKAISSFAKGRTIDIGCGTKPYAKMLAPYVSEHVGLEHRDSPHGLSSTDLIGSAYNIPSNDESFDTALCTAVLEHLEEPKDAIKECFRVLRPGGVAIYTVPFIWHLHEEPRDFYRYSKYGLNYLFQKSGFNSIDIKPLSGFWVTFGQLLVYNLYRLNHGVLQRSRLIDAVGLLLQKGAYYLDKVDRTEKWTWMYLVVARKPE